jgi:membrane associated rhomboid family serine protease
MFALWIFGAQLERQLGRARYLTLYLLSGLAGSAVSYAFSQPNQPRWEPPERCSVWSARPW